MNVTVIGSYRECHAAQLQGTVENFQKACEVIGENLARLGHRLFVPHPDDPDTAEVHALRGFKRVAPSRFNVCAGQQGDPDLKAHFDAVEKSDAVLLIGGHSGTYAGGLTALRRRKLILPVPAFGGSAKRLCEIPEIDYMLVDEIRTLDLKQENWDKSLAESVSKFVSAFPRVLIIHGRGDTGDDLQDRIRSSSPDQNSRLRGIASPVIMNLRGRGAISVPDLFEDLASQVSAAIAIVTADDVGGFARRDSGADSSVSELRLVPRARENVWIEVGWFWGRLGRDRVFLWLKDNIDLPSNLQGAAWTSYPTLDGAWESIEAFLAQLRSPT